MAGGDASSYLAGVRSGQDLGGTVVSAYQRAQERALQAQQEKPLTDEQLQKVQETGRLTGPGATKSAQVAALGAFEARETRKAISGAQIAGKEQTEAAKETAATAAAAIKDTTVATPEFLKKTPQAAALFQPGEHIPNRLVAEWTKTPTGGGAGGISADRFVQTEVDKFSRLANPLVAQRGTPLGVAGIMKARVATALATLEDPKLTPQMLAAVGTDLAGIVQMGAPHESGINDQNYQTWWSNFEKKVGYFRNAPQAADTPQTVARLKELLAGYDKVYSKFVRNNLKTQKAGFSPSTLDKYPTLKSSIEGVEKNVSEQYPLDTDTAIKENQNPVGYGKAPAGVGAEKTDRSTEEYRYAEQDGKHLRWKPGMANWEPVP